MIRAIIIDDEQHCTDRLCRLIQEHFSDQVLIMDSFSTVEDGLNGILRLQPELVLLDIQIHQHTGFELLQQLEKINFDILFTTAHEKFALHAFRFSAVDYLLKPIDLDDLHLAIEKVKSKKTLTENAKKFETLLFNVEAKNKRLCIPTMQGFEYIDVADIIRCESDVNYTTLFMKNSKLMVSKTLKEFEEMLIDYGFFRIHNSHIINIKHIKSYHKGKGGFVTLNDNTQIEVSTRRKEDFLTYIREKS